MIGFPCHLLPLWKPPHKGLATLSGIRAFTYFSTLLHRFEEHYPRNLSKNLTLLTPFPPFSTPLRQLLPRLLSKNRKKCSTWNIPRPPHKTRPPALFSCVAPPYSALPRILPLDCLSPRPFCAATLPCTLPRKSLPTAAAPMIPSQSDSPRSFPPRPLSNLRKKCSTWNIHLPAPQNPPNLRCFSHYFPALCCPPLFSLFHS